MEPFDSIEKLINEHGSAAILRERITLAKEQYAALERRVEEKTKELEIVKGQNEVLRKQLSTIAVPDKYVPARGVLWLRTAVGFDPEPYCPKCKIIMFDFPPGARENWNCSQCMMTVPYSSPPTVA